MEISRWFFSLLYENAFFCLSHIDKHTNRLLIILRNFKIVFIFAAFRFFSLTPFLSNFYRAITLIAVPVLKKVRVHGAVLNIAVIVIIIISTEKK